ncbi:hypothetical protein [Georgenia yuyongxinii]
MRLSTQRHQRADALVAGGQVGDAAALDDGAGEVEDRAVDRDVQEVDADDLEGVGTEADQGGRFADLVVRPGLLAELLHETLLQEGRDQVGDRDARQRSGPGQIRPRAWAGVEQVLKDHGPVLGAPVPGQDLARGAKSTYRHVC